jgi:hypothetical protein
MDEVDKAIAVYKPDSWKSYSVGDPLAPSKFPWRLDDEQVMHKKVPNHGRPIQSIDGGSRSKMAKL